MPFHSGIFDAISGVAQSAWNTVGPFLTDVAGGILGGITASPSVWRTPPTAPDWGPIGWPGGGGTPNIPAPAPSSTLGGTIGGLLGGLGAQVGSQALTCAVNPNAPGCRTPSAPQQITPWAGTATPSAPTRFLPAQPSTPGSGPDSAAPHGHDEPFDISQYQQAGIGAGIGAVLANPWVQTGLGIAAHEGLNYLQSFGPQGGAQVPTLPGGASVPYGQGMSMVGQPYGGMVFRPAPTGPRARSVLQIQNPYTGRMMWYRNMGTPILWSGDLSSAKRVRKAASRARRGR